MHGCLFSKIATLIASCMAFLFFISPPQPVTQLRTNTWTIVAVDPETGQVGVAGASCVPGMHIDAVAAMVPGVGAAAVQADFDISNRDYVYQLLQEGISAGEIIQQVSDPAYDRNVERRQYGVVTLIDGQVSTAGYTGRANLAWAGELQDLDMGVSVQGNTLVSEAVVRDSLEAFRANDLEGHNTLADRLMRALEAGSAAGGDARCNNDEVRQTASSAFLMVAQASDAPYAIRDFGTTEAGNAGSPWLSLSTAGPRYGPNPIEELRRQYELWHARTVEESKISSNIPGIFLGIGIFLLLGLVYLFYNKQSTRGI